MTTNIHVVIPVIDRSYDITEQISRNHENYIVIPVIHLIYNMYFVVSWLVCSHLGLELPCTVCCCYLILSYYRHSRIVL